MRECLSKRTKNGSSSDRAIIILFFLAGGAAVFFSPIPVPNVLGTRGLLSGILCGVLLLSASTLGGFLLPVFALIFGAVTECAAMSFADSFTAGTQWQLRPILCSAVLVPVFFLVLLHGMSLSGCVQAALLGGNPTARTDYRRELGSQLACALVGFAAIFYFY